MSDRILNLSDNMTGLKDAFSFSNSPARQALYKPFPLRGEVTVKNELGEVLFTKSNTIVAGGRRFVLEKIFNIDPTATPRITKNHVHGVNDVTDTYNGPGPRQNESILLFGVGTGGADITFGSVFQPNKTNFDLFEPIPLRYVDDTDDLDSAEQANYFMKVTQGNKFAYYLKKFTTEPTLVMKKGNNPFVPDESTDNEIFDQGGNLIVQDAVDIYVDINFKVNELDVREWFMSTSNITQARINEIGLYYGYFNPSVTGEYQDINNCQLFSILTFDNEPLNLGSKSLIISYRIYC